VISTANPITASGVVVYAATDEGPHFLLLQSARHQTWGFAKGHLEDGETLTQCALRELEEETGFQLCDDDLYPHFNDCASYTLPDSARPKRSVMFLAKSAVKADALVASAEHQQFKWCDLSSAIQLLEHPQSQRCLIRAADWLANN
jgi:bis(5'-nucleosidyl)-tetraphosphatase